MLPCTAQLTNRGPKQGAILRGLGEELGLKWKSGENGDANLGDESIYDGIIKNAEPHADFKNFAKLDPAAMQGAFLARGSWRNLVVSAAWWRVRNHTLEFSGRGAERGGGGRWRLHLEFSAARGELSWGT